MDKILESQKKGLEIITEVMTLGEYDNFEKLTPERKQDIILRVKVNLMQTCYALGDAAYNNTPINDNLRHLGGKKAVLEGFLQDYA